MKIIVSGAYGKMGSLVIERAKSFDGVTVVGGVDQAESNLSYPFGVWKTASEITENADVIIDFSRPALTEKIVDFATSENTPLVIATTGHDKRQMQGIYAASEKIPIFLSSNTSEGIYLLSLLAKRLAFSPFEADVEIVEYHHNRKTDAPSGTAELIAEELLKVLPSGTKTVCGRRGSDSKREKNEIGVHSVRGGTIVGTHEIIFAGQNETITLTHVAQDRSVFADGAIKAAKFLLGKPKGLYGMEELFREFNSTTGLT